MVESVTFAFQLALEALTPQQRAVLILRDVFAYSASETGRVLNADGGWKPTKLEATTCRPHGAVVTRRLMRRER